MKQKFFLLFALLWVVSTSNAQSGRDINSDGVVNLSDVTELVNYILNPNLNPTFSVNGVSFEMIPVEGGTFTMGATEEQVSYADADEKPAHKVTLSSYMIGKTEVTQELWQAVMGTKPGYFSGTNLPVEKVSWEDCQAFINKLNAVTGKTFRLPTEAEWEFAARGSNKSKGYVYSGSNTLNDVAWYGDNSSGTHPVATKAPNELGIYDMSGNVWEWCSDWYSYNYYSVSPEYNPPGYSSASARVIRGGSWDNSAGNSRVSYRGSYAPTTLSYYLGLRLAAINVQISRDVNSDGVVNLSDVTELINYILIHH